MHDKISLVRQDTRQDLICQEMIKSSLREVWRYGELMHNPISTEQVDRDLTRQSQSVEIGHTNVGPADRQLPEVILPDKNFRIVRYV